ncbi:unnamed protein product [Amoebophrya sp. A25]|nr:unnamed protein product [Amoebophrya sp. A25]|eukprot:GSA25T00015686001.1
MCGKYELLSRIGDKRAVASALARAAHDPDELETLLKMQETEEKLRLRNIVGASGIVGGEYREIETERTTNNAFAPERNATRTTSFASAEHQDQYKKNVRDAGTTASGNKAVFSVSDFKQHWHRLQEQRRPLTWRGPARELRTTIENPLLLKDRSSDADERWKKSSSRATTSTRISGIDGFVFCHERILDSNAISRPDKKACFQHYYTTINPSKTATVKLLLQPVRGGNACINSGDHKIT